MNRRPLRLIAAAYVALVLWVTIGLVPWHTNGDQFDSGILNPDAWTSPITWTTGYLSEMAFNVAMFVPVGVLGALLIPRRRWPLALVAGFAFTLFIELVQMPQPDRISDPRDLVMNTAGAVLGVLVVLAARLVRRAGRVAGREVPMVVLPGGAAAAGTAAGSAPAGAAGHEQVSDAAHAGVDAEHEPALAAASADRAA